MSSMRVKASEARELDARTPRREAGQRQQAALAESRRVVPARWYSSDGLRRNAPQRGPLGPATASSPRGRAPAGDRGRRRAASIRGSDADQRQDEHDEQHDDVAAPPIAQSR